MTFNLQDDELNKILNDAYQYSALSQKALWQQQDYYFHVYEEQNALLAQNAYLYANVKNNIDISSLQLNAIERIDRDVHYIQQLNKELNAYPEETFTWSLITNKMELVLSGAKELVLDDTSFAQILEGQIPFGFDNSPPSIVAVGDTSGIYGNSKLSYLSGAIVEVHLSLLADDSQIQDIQLENYPCGIDHSAITHVTPIPETIELDAIAPSFTENFSFFFSDELTPQGLAFVHSGYAFGGHRFEERYPDGKDLGPEDCSSWIAKIIDSDVSFSTIDQLFTYRMALPEETRGFIDPKWLTSEYAKTMETLSPVLVEDPLTDIHPGQVFAFRTFDTEDHLGEGLSGHTGLVLGVRENGDVVTMNYRRNMPEFEGFGLSEFSWKSTDKREMMFFDVKTKPISMDDVFCDHAIENIPHLPSPVYAPNSENNAFLVNVEQVALM
jgi:hypothetical protein